ncbi:hypothetical protein AB3480_24080 [Rhizobium mongolense]|uniref:hypothetical protein n=1 Tax=Rhizobium mongolense TaxID=57676 RepID=UPI0034A52FE6
MKLTYSKTHSPVQIRFNLPSSVEKHYTAKHILASAVKNAFERKKAQYKFASTSKKRMRSCHHPNLPRRNTHVAGASTGSAIVESLERYIARNYRSRRASDRQPLPSG